MTQELRAKQLLISSYLALSDPDETEANLSDCESDSLNTRLQEIIFDHKIKRSVENATQKQKVNE